MCVFALVYVCLIIYMPLFADPCVSVLCACTCSFHLSSSPLLQPIINLFLPLLPLFISLSVLSPPLLFSPLLFSFSPLQYFFSLFHFSLSSIIYFRNIVRSKSGIFACPKSVINSHLVTDKKVKIKERIFSIFVSVL